MAAYSCQFQDGSIGLTLVDKTEPGGEGVSVVVDEISPESQASQVKQLEVGHILV